MEIVKIEICHYIRKVKMSNKQRPVYYEYDEETQTISAKGKKVLYEYLSDTFKSIQASNDDRKRVHVTYLKDKYGIKEVRNGKKVLFNLLLDEPVLANRTQAGKPRYEIITGQSIYSASVHPFARRKIMDEIKKSFYSYVKDIAPFEPEMYPIRVKLLIFDTVKNMFDRSKDPDNPGQAWDITNRAYPYSKAMLDLLATGIIEGEKVLNKPPLYDDDRLHITEDGGAIFCPIEDEHKRKLVFVFFKDTREHSLQATAYIESLRKAHCNLDSKYYMEARELVKQYIDTLNRNNDDVF